MRSFQTPVTSGNLRLTAELALGADLARHARHLGGEHAELLDHGVDDVGRLQKFAAQRAAIDIELHGLQQVALGDGRDGPGHFARRPEQIVDQRVDGAFHVGPGAAGKAELDALPGFSFPADDLTDPLQLLRHALVGGHDFIERIGNFSFDPEMIAHHSHGKIATSHRLKRMKQVLR